MLAVCYLLHSTAVIVSDTLLFYVDVDRDPLFVSRMMFRCEK